jgi:hypothetical protein
MIVPEMPERGDGLRRIVRLCCAATARRTRVAVYQCNIVRPNRSIVSTETILCGDDTEAISRGCRLLDQNGDRFDIEVWQQGRRIYPPQRKA